MALDKEMRSALQAEFKSSLQDMAELLGKGRQIELLIRIAFQTRQQREELRAESRTYEEFMNADASSTNPNPNRSLSDLVPNSEVSNQLTAARDIADKVAHGLFFHAKNLIDEYSDAYSLTTDLTDNQTVVWRADLEGHILDEEKKIRTIVHAITISDDLLIVEQFDWFKDNHYYEAAAEIFEWAAKVLTSEIGPDLPSELTMVRILRGFKFGERTYME